MSSPRWRGARLADVDVQEVAQRVRRALLARGIDPTPGIPFDRVQQDHLARVQLVRELTRCSRHRILARETDPARVIEAIHDGEAEVDRAAGCTVASAHVCGRCGTAYLLPTQCCGRRTRRSPMPYHATVNSPRMIDRPRWSVVILTRNHLDLTRTTVETLRQARGADQAEWVVVDCESTDGTLQYLMNLAAELSMRVIVCPDREPFIYGRNVNRGAAVATGELLLLANNDIRNRSAALLERLEAPLRVPRVGVVGVEGLSASRDDLTDGGGYTRCPVPVVGYLWAMRAEMFWELGGMDEQFDGYGCDEVEFQYRLVKRHYHIALARVRVRHRLHATFGRDIWQSPLGLRNYLLFEGKHGLAGKRGRHREFREWRDPVISIICTVEPGLDADRIDRSLRAALECDNPTGTQLQCVIAAPTPTIQQQRVLAAVASDYPDAVNLHCLPRPMRQTDAHEWALERSIGTYVAPLRVGDAWLPHRLRQLYGAVVGAGVRAAGAVESDPFTCLLRRDRSPDGEAFAQVDDLLTRPATAPHTPLPPARAAAGRPMVSVVIPCYGRKELFRDALWSCLEQDYDPLEVILVDDGSSPPLEVPYEDRRIRLTRQPRNRGPSAARNAGLRAARGEYVKFLDSDDVLAHRDVLGRLAAAAEEEQADLVYGDCLMVNIVTGRIGRLFDGQLDESLYGSNFLNPSRVLVRRSLGEQVQFPEHMRLGEDWAYFMHCVWREHLRVTHVNEVLVLYRLNDESASNAWAGSLERYSDMLESQRQRLLRIWACEGGPIGGS